MAGRSSSLLPWPFSDRSCSLTLSMKGSLGGSAMPDLIARDLEWEIFKAEGVFRKTVSILPLYGKLSHNCMCGVAKEENLVIVLLKWSVSMS